MLSLPQTCRLPQAEAQCRGGLCLIDACLPGFQNCNADPADGCEVSTRTDPQNCGACRLSCWNEHGTSECREGVCQPVCDALWGDCDGNPANGCEASFDSQAHCGACGRACSGSDQCVGGECRADCPDADGDGLAASRCGGADCDDTNRDIQPQATEVCDGRDNNCDGEADEGLDCREEPQPDDIRGGCGCSAGPSGSLGGLLLLVGLLVMRRR